MAILDKLNAIAKNVGEKAGDTIEITKLNSKITSEKSAINELYKQLGEKLYQRYASGAYSDAEFASLFAAVDGHMAAIAECEQGKEAIRAAKAQSAEPEAAAPAESEADVPAAAVCAACGAVVAEGAKFCNMCGAKMDTAVEKAPAKRFCSACGQEAEAGVKFCCCCGAKIE